MLYFPETLVQITTRYTELHMNVAKEFPRLKIASVPLSQKEIVNYISFAHQQLDNKGGLGAIAGWMIAHGAACAQQTTENRNIAMLGLAIHETLNGI